MNYRLIKGPEIRRTQSSVRMESNNNIDFGPFHNAIMYITLELLFTVINISA